MRRVVAVLALAACGRIGYEPTPDAANEWRLSSVVEAMVGYQVVVQTREGDLVIVALNVGGDDAVAIADDIGSTYVEVADARAQNFGAIEVWYAAGVRAGSRTITITMAGADDPEAIVAWVVENMRTANVLDAAAALSFQPDTTAPRGPAIVTSADGDFVVSIVKGNVVSGTSAGNAFTNDSLARTDGYAHLTDPRAPRGTYQAQWDADSSAYCSSAVAFFVGP